MVFKSKYAMLKNERKKWAALMRHQPGHVTLSDLWTPPICPARAGSSRRSCRWPAPAGSATPGWSPVWGRCCWRWARKRCRSAAWSPAGTRHTHQHVFWPGHTPRCSEPHLVEHVPLAAQVQVRQDPRRPAAAHGEAGLRDAGRHQRGLPFAQTREQVRELGEASCGRWRRKRDEHEWQQMNCVC